MQKLIVFIPGMMGSRLKQTTPAGTTWMWNEDAYASMSQLAANAALLEWRKIAFEPAGVLGKVKILWKTYDLCKLFREEMLQLESMGNYEYAEYSYDWRQNILESAKQLGEWLTRKYGFKVDATGRQAAEAEPTLHIITHSMGSLVAALALTKGYVNPANLRRLICVGAPFLGSPSAFRALYTVGYLTGMKWLERWVNLRKDAGTCRKNLRKTFQSFVSAYQLLPHQNSLFVEVKGRGKVNPLSLPVIDPVNKTAAADVHAELLTLEATLQSYPHLNNQYHFIYSEHPHNTDGEYRAREDAAGTTFEGVRCVGSTDGDGTVPIYSAMFGKKGASRAGVVGVKHMYMLNDKDVVQLVMSYL